MMIEGVAVKELKVHPDERGMLMEILRRDDEIFNGFGQVYLTTGYPDVVKAWHYHKLQWDYFCVVKGMMKLVLFDDRKNSPTRGEVNEFFMGQQRPRVVRIPPEVYHGFKAYGEEPALVINTVTEPYNAGEPDEYRLDPFENDIPYDWDIKHG